MDGRCRSTPGDGVLHRQVRARHFASTGPPRRPRIRPPSSGVYSPRLPPGWRRRAVPPSPPAQGAFADHRGCGVQAFSVVITTGGQAWGSPGSADAGERASTATGLPKVERQTGPPAGQQEQVVDRQRPLAADEEARLRTNTSSTIAGTPARVPGSRRSPVSGLACAARGRRCHEVFSCASAPALARGRATSRTSIRCRQQEAVEGDVELRLQFMAQAPATGEGTSGLAV